MGGPGPSKTQIQLACNNRAEQDWHPAFRSLDAGCASASCLRLPATPLDWHGQPLAVD
jgi:hypothetical protein